MGPHLEHWQLKIKSVKNLIICIDKLTASILVIYFCVETQIANDTLCLVSTSFNGFARCKVVAYRLK